MLDMQSAASIILHCLECGLPMLHPTIHRGFSCSIHPNWCKIWSIRGIHSMSYQKTTTHFALQKRTNTKTKDPANGPAPSRQSRPTRRHSQLCIFVPIRWLSMLLTQESAPSASTACCSASIKAEPQSHQADREKEVSARLRNLRSPAKSDSLSFSGLIRKTH